MIIEDALHLLTRNAEPGKRAAAIMAVAVHGLLALFLIYGVRWQTSTPAAVAVELVRSVPVVAPQVEPQPEPVVEPKPVEPTPPPVAKPESPQKPDIVVEKKKEKVKPEPKPSFDPMQEQLRKEMQQTRQASTANAAAQELNQLKNSQAASAKNKAVADYLSKIRGKLRSKIEGLPPNIQGNPEATFEVTQLPTGEVLSVRLKRSSGNDALDKTIERAILKSSPLPKPDSPELFSRLLELKFRPLEN